MPPSSEQLKTAIVSSSAGKHPQTHAVLLLTILRPEYDRNIAKVHSRLFHNELLRSV